MKISSCDYRRIVHPCSLANFNYQIDPYIGCSHYCFYCYVLDQAETDWTKEIWIHENIEHQLVDEINDLKPQIVYMGYHSDPYQPCEAEYGQTRKVLELLAERGFSASILTKSDLVVRDMDILSQMKDAAVSVSVAFHDNRIREFFEADTVDTEKRIDALRKFKEKGIRTGALVCPVFPYISDAARLIDMIQPYADVIWIYGLSISDPSGKNWKNVKRILNDRFPDLKETVERAIFSKHDDYWLGLRKDLMDMKKERKLEMNIHV